MSGHVSSQAILPHRDTGEIRGYLKAKQDTLLRQIPTQAWTVCVKGKPILAVGEKNESFLKSIASALERKGTKLANKNSGWEGSVSNLSSRGRGVGQCARKPSTTSAKLGSVAQRPTHRLVPISNDGIFGTDPEPSLKRTLSKPAPSKLGLPGPPKARSDSFKAPAQPITKQSSIQQRISGASTAVSAGAKSEPVEAMPAASASRPQVSALSGAATPVRSPFETPEVQSPLKQRPPLVPDSAVPASKFDLNPRSSRTENTGLHQSHGVAAANHASTHDKPSHASQDDTRRGREHDAHASQHGSRHSQPSSRDPSPKMRARKRSRSPSAVSRSRSRERGRASHRSSPDRPRHGIDQRGPNDGERSSSHVPARLRDEPKAGPDHPRAADVSGSQLLGAPAKTASPAIIGAEGVRPRSAREIIKGISTDPSASASAPDLDQRESGANNVQQLQGPPSLPQQSSSTSRIPDRERSGADGQSLPTAARTHSRFKPDTNASRDKSPFMASVPSPDDADDVLPRATSTTSASVPGHLAKTVRIGSTLSIMDIGSMLEKESSRHAHKVSPLYLQMPDPLAMQSAALHS